VKSGVKSGEAKQKNNLPPECGQPIDGGVAIMIFAINETQKDFPSQTVVDGNETFALH
jgi:hypothetical protein